MLLNNELNVAIAKNVLLAVIALCASWLEIESPLFCIQLSIE